MPKKNLKRKTFKKKIKKGKIKKRKTFKKKIKKRIKQKGGDPLPKCVTDGKIPTGVFTKLDAKKLKDNYDNCGKNGIANGALQALKGKAENKKIKIISLLKVEFTPEQLNKAGYTIADYRQEFTPLDLLNEGLLPLGRSRKAFDFTILKNLGFDINEIKNSINTFTIQNAIETGFSSTDIIDAGFTKPEIESFLKGVDCKIYNDSYWVYKNKDSNGKPLPAQRVCEEVIKGYCTKPEFQDLCSSIKKEEEKKKLDHALEYNKKKGDKYILLYAEAKLAGIKTNNENKKFLPDYEIRSALKKYYLPRIEEGRAFFDIRNDLFKNENRAKSYFNWLFMKRNIKYCVTLEKEWGPYEKEAECDGKYFKELRDEYPTRRIY
jgi:hypothetical protein